MSLTPYFAAALLGYVLGSIPTAIWICKVFSRVDITQVGSKNPGMTNVWRTLGWKYAVPVAIIDAAKGFFAAWLAWNIGAFTESPQSIALVGGVFAVLGHSLSFLAGFRGGKGVLTAFGVFLALTPLASLISLAAWSLVMWRWRIVSLASLASAVVLPPLVYWEEDWKRSEGLRPIFFAALAISLWVAIRHRSNIVRLAQGTEPRFGRSKV